MRLNQPQSANDLVNTIKSQEFTKEPIKPHFQRQTIFTKRQLWHIFLKEFRVVHGVGFIQTEENIKNVEVLFYYFLQDDAFFECSNLRAEISKPSFNKGLMIVGAYGIGKTAYLKVFEKIFKTYPDFRFRGFGVKDLVREYEACKTPVEKTHFIQQKVRPGLFLDDIASERVANNFGKCDVVEEILFSQHEKGYKTYVTCNHTNSQNNVEQSVMDIGKRYDGRIHDRFYQMFNIIEFSGKSMRR